MKNSKYTPGPWMIRPTQDQNDIFALKIVSSDKDIAEVYHGDINGDLIAAAPELLEALEILTKQLEYNGAKINSNNNLYAIIVKAESAIAKARGEK